MVLVQQAAATANSSNSSSKRNSQPKMSQAGPPDGDKRSRKRKLKHSRLLLEQLPSAPPSSGKQKQHKRQQPEQPEQQDALSAGNSKFARALGSTDFHTREQGLQALSRWLTHKQLVPELDMLKLWKGIYFCFWHSDKEPVQVGEQSFLFLTVSKPTLSKRTVPKRAAKRSSVAGPAARSHPHTCSTARRMHAPTATTQHNRPAHAASPAAAAAVVSGGPC